MSGIGNLHIILPTLHHYSVIDIWRIANNDVKSVFIIISVEYITKPSMPEEEFVIFGKIDFLELLKNYRVVCLCLQLFVDSIRNFLL